MSSCATCGQQISDVGVICHKCSGRLRRNLLDVPDLLAELLTTALRQTNTGEGRGGDALPFDQRARDAQQAIQNAVNGWCRVVLGEIGCDEPDELKRRGAALWLAERTGRIRLQPWADDCATSIDQVVRAGWRAIDRPDKRWFAGPCPATLTTDDGQQVTCGHTLWARIDRPTVTCTTCGTGQPVTTRRQWLISAAQDVVDTAVNISAAITLMARTRISAAQIRKWHWRHTLADAGRSDSGAWLYRFGDVLALVERRDATADPDKAHHFERARFDRGDCDSCRDGNWQDVGRCDWCGQWICEHCAARACPSAPQEQARTDEETPDDRQELTAV